MTAARHTILAFLLVLAQAAIDNYVNMTVYLDIALCLFIVLTLPPKWGAIPSMIAGFAVGVGVDILGNGIIGHVGSCNDSCSPVPQNRILLSGSKRKRQASGI